MATWDFGPQGQPDGTAARFVLEYDQATERAVSMTCENGSPSYSAWAALNNPGGQQTWEHTFPPGTTVEPLPTGGRALRVRVAADGEPVAGWFPDFRFRVPA